jgi:hypothetical protein
MVTRERAQLLLTSSILIALVIVSTVVLLNGMQFTENVGDDNAVGEAEHAAHVQEMIRADMVEMLNRTGANIPLDTRRYRYAAYSDWLERNISDYNTQHQNMTLSRRLASVSVESMPGESTKGRVIYQEAPNRDFQSVGDRPDWQVGHGVTEVPVIVLQDVDVTSSPPLILNVSGYGSNASEFWRLKMKEDEIVVESSQSSGTVLCSGTGLDTHEFDVVIKGGETQVYPHASSVECKQPKTDLRDMKGWLDNGFLEYENGNSAKGNYTITIDGGITPSRFGPTQPDHSEIRVINPKIRVVYNGTEITSVSEFKVYEEVP